MKTIQKSYDALIIGFGKGGKTLAAFLAKEGWNVAVIEQSALMYGGTCINIACIPTKSLVHSAETNMPYEEAVSEKNRLTSSLRQRNFEMVDNQPGATVITGTATFVSPRQISVRLADTGEDVFIEAGKIFINTGAKPIVPSIPGIEYSQRIFTSTTLIDQTELPEELVIIGAGYIALEFASMYAQFGSKVTLLDRSAIFLPNEDRDIADAIQTILINKGISIEQGAQIDRIIPGEIEDTIIYHQGEMSKEVTATAILVATGRRPVTENLNLSAAGVEQDDRGYIRVNEHLQTTAENIWAIGDVNGGPQFTYISLDDFRIIRSQLFPKFEPHTTLDRKYIASSLFITPPLAQVGLREREAIEKGYRIKVASIPAAASTRPQILRQTEGVLKAIVDADTNRILGCTLLCVNSSELINLVQVAMQAGLDYKILRDTIYTHPSSSEIFNDLFGKI